jgi:hypothetical protein
MAGGHSYTDWRRSWPDLIVHTQTETAVDYLQQYYSSTAAWICSL